MGVKFDKILGKLREADGGGKVMQPATVSGASPTKSDVASWPVGACGILVGSGGAVFFGYKAADGSLLAVEMTK